MSELIESDRRLRLPKLVCPLDFAELIQEDGGLLCRGGHQFKIVEEIPRILVEETSYADAFGAQWNAYRKTQLDSYTRTSISRDRLRRCIGEDLWAQLGLARTTSILEVGAGAGRFTEVLLSLSGAAVTSTDLSSAVDANLANCPASDRHRVIQCDVHALPFPSESYDLVVCLGVIQHTPNPENTIELLYRQVKPGGWLVLDHYRPSLSHYTKVTSLLLRPILKRLSPKLGLIATDFLTKVFFPLHRAVKGHRWAQVILSRVSPVMTFFQAYPELDDQLQFQWALLDTHDYLTDYYKHLRTCEQARRILNRLGACAISVSKGGNGVEARCRKPEK